MSEPSDDARSDSGLLRFIAPGMRLTYELTAVGELMTLLGHRIIFTPVVGAVAWADKKELVMSLRVRHITADRKEVGQSLLDRDEVDVWTKLLRDGLAERDRECSPSRLWPTSLRYSTRHGIEWTWNDPPTGGYSLHVLSQHLAILPGSSVVRLLEVFSEFEDICLEWLDLQ